MSDDAPLDEEQGWLLNRIAAGRGNEVTIPHNVPRTGHRLEAMEQADLISVRRTPEGWRCGILGRGRTALREWRQRMVEQAQERLKVKAK